MNQLQISSSNSGGSTYTGHHTQQYTIPTPTAGGTHTNATGIPSHTAQYTQQPPGWTISHNPHYLQQVSVNENNCRPTQCIV